MKGRRSLRRCPKRPNFWPIGDARFKDADALVGRRALERRARRPVSHTCGRGWTCLPTTRLTTDDLMSTTRHHTHIDLERLTGIHERRVSVGEDDLQSATAAAMDALIGHSARPLRSTR